MKTLSQSTVPLNISAPIGFVILNVENCMSVMHVWRENRVKDPETRIKTSRQDIKREGRLGTSVCLRPVEWQKSQLTRCLHCRRPVQCTFAYAVPIEYFKPGSNEWFIEDQAFSPSYKLAPPLSPSARCLYFSVFLLGLTDGRWVGGGGGSRHWQIIRRQESLVL